MWFANIFSHSCPQVKAYRKCGSIYIMEYYSALRRKEIPSFATTWVKMEGIMLSEITYSIDCLFTLLMVSFAVQLFSLM